MQKNELHGDKRFMVSPYYRTMQNTPPSVPERDSSLSGHVTKDDELLFLAGRKPYTSPAATPQSTQLASSTSTSSLTSEGVGLPLALAQGDTMDRIFNGSSVSLANSEDATSIHSVASEHDSRRNMLLRPSSAPGQSTAASKSSSASRPESPNPPGYVCIFFFSMFAYLILSLFCGY